jgi:hypothetical protein
MDEVLQSGWRKKVEDAFDEGNKWPLYKHVNGRDEKGNPIYYHHFRIHPRRGFYWKYPIHEVLMHEPNLTFERKIIDLEVDHIKDESKSRKSYLDLLERAVQEEPNDWRMNHYLNREYFYNFEWLKVLQSASRCEQLKGGWDIERASTYMWASEAAHRLLMPSLSEDWARKATEASQSFYEAWHWRSHIAHLYGKWEECLEFSRKRLTLERQSHHLVKPDVWDWWGYDLIALASHKLEKNEDALFYGETAFFRNPKNQRLRSNLDFYRDAYRISGELKTQLSVRDKLQGFPPIRAISLNDAHERKAKFSTKLTALPEIKLQYIQAVRSESRDYQDIDNAILASHLKALDDFLNNPSDDWTLIAEDDINFELVSYWPFTWQEKLEHFRRHEIEIAQLCVSTNRVEDLDTQLHPRKNGFDWCCAAYLVSRVGATRIVNKMKSKSSPVEENLFTGLTVFSEALFTCDVDNKDAFHAKYQESVFKPAFDKAMADMKARAKAIR